MSYHVFSPELHNFVLLSVENLETMKKKTIKKDNPVSQLIHLIFLFCLIKLNIFNNM